MIPFRPLLALAAALVAAAPVHAASFGGVEVPPPPAARPVTETFHGTTVVSPYRFLEDTKDPQVQSWMKAQNDATEAIFARIPGRETMLARIREIESKASGVTQSAERAAPTGATSSSSGTRRTTSSSSSGARRRTGPDRLIVDPEALAKATGTPHAVMDFAASPDGRRVAYSMQAGGGEIGTLHVVDLQSGKPLIEPIDRIRYAERRVARRRVRLLLLAVAREATRSTRGERFDDHARHFRSLADAQGDRNVFSALRRRGPRPAALRQWLPVPDRGTDARRQPGVLRRRSLPGCSISAISTRHEGDRDWTKVRRSTTRRSTSALPAATSTCARRSALPASRSSACPSRRPIRPRPRSSCRPPTSVIVAMRAARDALYVVRRDGATHSLWRLEAQAGREAGADRPPVRRRDRADRRLGPARRRRVRSRRLDARHQAVGLRSVGRQGRQLPVRRARRLRRAGRHHGARDPLPQPRRRRGADVDRDAQGREARRQPSRRSSTATAPTARPRIRSSIRAGTRGCSAAACSPSPTSAAAARSARSGTWPAARRPSRTPGRTRSPAAEWLIAHGYTSKAKIGIYGGSAGGIFVGRAITERPDLFAAAVPAVGDFDAPRFETGSNGAANIPEFGTVKNEEEFRR
jgi:prolyl oligopeptidase